MNRGPVVVIGDVMADVITRMSGPIAHGSDTAAEIVLRPGGSGANTAAWLGHLGVPTVFVGCVGDDALGRDARQALEVHGVTTALAVVADVPTGTCVVLVDLTGERSMLPDAGANAFLLPEHLPAEGFAPGGHLHVSGYTLIRESSRDAAAAAIARAHRAGMTTSVDPASAAPLAQIGAAAFLSLITGVDLVFITRDEGEILCGSREPTEIARQLLGTHAEVVVKLGDEGATWFADGEPPCIAAPHPTPHVIDTTGAGDAFAAGFLGTRLHMSPTRSALSNACRLAASAVGAPGARPRR